MQGFNNAVGCRSQKLDFITNFFLKNFLKTFYLLENFLLYASEKPS